MDNVEILAGDFPVIKRVKTETNSGGGGPGLCGQVTLEYWNTNPSEVVYYLN